MATVKCMTCVAVLLLACFISTSNAQATANPNFKMPKNIKSYSQYLKYVGMAQGILPIEPFAEEAFAPAPSQGAEAPSGAPAGEAQPDFMANREVNTNPTIQDFVEAYQPVSKALDYAFENRITKDNAQQVQYNLAIAAAPLQMLINDANQAQLKSFQKVASEVFGQNPLTGTTATPATTEAQPTTASDGTTVASTAATSATTAADASEAPAAASANPLGWLRIPNFLGKK